MSEWSPFRKFVPKRRLLSWQDLLALAVVGACGLWLWISAARLPEYGWQWGLLRDFIAVRSKSGSLEPGLLITGLFTTLRIGFWTFCFSICVGGGIGIISTRRSTLLSLSCMLYVNIVRNIPPLVILFAVYFFAGSLLPAANLEDAIRMLPEPAKQAVAIIFAAPGQIDRMLAAVLALGSYQAAYVAEITRGGIESVPQGQWDAARALGFGRSATILLIILPQAARSMWPPLTGQCISTFKDSALASLISLPDLTFQSLEIMAVSRMTFEIWISTAVLYLLIGLICACLGRWLEHKYSIFLN